MTPRLGIAKRRAVRTAGGLPGQWWTDSKTALEFASWAQVEGLRVIDGCAGLGALSVACLRARAQSVLAIELDERLVPRLDEILSGWAPRTRVVCADFLGSTLTRDLRQITLETGPAADVVVGNPPWEDDFPERFLMRAVELAPRACAILPLNILCGLERSRIWRTSLEPTRARALARRPPFFGTTGGMRDVCFIEVRARRSPLPPHVDVTLQLEVGR
jgi:16S rRNA G966 N2-methylase RsmD